MRNLKTYSQLIKLKSFDDRYEYLKLSGEVGVSTFGFDRHINQLFYKSYEWRSIRRDVIIRDNGCDLGVDGYDIYTTLLIHHMNPITQKDIMHGDPAIIDPEYLITTTKKTHNAIHFGDSRYEPSVVIERSANDTQLW